MIRKRWECPKCHHVQLAPSKPRRDDARRYCLKCSDKTGRLVERTCATLEKKRVEKSSARVERVRKTKEKEAAKMSEYPMSLYAAAKKYAKLKAWERDLSHIDVKIRRGSSVPSSGRAYYYRENLVVTAGIDPADGFHVLLHELAHHAAYLSLIKGWNGYPPRPYEPPHGPRFRSFLHVAVEEVVGHRVNAPSDRHGDTYIKAIREALGLPTRGEVVEKQNQEEDNIRTRFLERQIPYEIEAGR